MNLIALEKKENFFNGLKDLFASLQVPVNYIDEKAIAPKVILSKTFKDNNTAYQLMEDVFVLGMVDNAAFEGTKSETIASITKGKKDYDGILLFGVTLKNREKGLLPTRSQLAEITRAFNREFYYTPVVVVFRYEQFISIANAERITYKQEWREGEKAGKVSLLRDINVAKPHTGHLKILQELTISRSGKGAVNTFADLYTYWQSVFNVSILNKKFYKELSDWYFWALQEVHFPTTNWAADKSSILQEDDKVKEHNAKNLIRMLTRLLFVWFVKEKKLIPEELFDETYIKDNLINGFEPRKKKGFERKTLGSKYYRAILQNLFFATLNQTVGKREFRKDGAHMNVTNLMRYESYFKNPKAFVKLVENIVPFMNGGLFECLDSPDPLLKGKRGGDVIIYEDGFSDRKDNALCVPDYIFFGTDEHADLSEELGDKKHKDVTVNGLINILNSYKFTVTENTPIEEDVALDPELLGRVFENLLASYNPETKTTARKQTGSFYTPREIVNYMVDESLKAYLKQKLETEFALKPEEAERKLELLIGYNETYFHKENRFDDKQTAVIIKAIDNCKILDPACGSGAFPMGILHKLVHILHKLDADNKIWKEVQRQKAIKETDEAFKIGNKQERESRLKEISDVFQYNSDDYGRKLFLIENCIYGVDIQPIATQISKLRFFISLIVDQKADKTRDNFGIRPLPNLETKFVAANTLISIEKPKSQGSLFDSTKVKELVENLKDVRHRLFSAKTPSTKRKLREEDQKLREEMGTMLESAGWGNETAKQLAGWDPYNQNASSPFFHPEWMFGIGDGFDVVIGNPPYGAKIDKLVLAKLKNRYLYAIKGKIESYRIFIECGIQLAKNNSRISFIIPNTWMYIEQADLLRKFILEHTCIAELVSLPQSVFDASVDSVVLSVAKLKPNIESSTYVVDIPLKLSLSDLSKYLKNRHSYQQVKWLNNNKYLITYGQNEESSALIDAIRNKTEKLGQYVYFRQGLIPYLTKEEGRENKYISATKKGADWSRYLDGSRCVDRYHLKGNISYIKYGDWLYAQREKNIFHKPRIIYQLIRNISLKQRVVATYLDYVLYSDRNTGLIFCNEKCMLSLKTVLGLLNSTLINYVHAKTHNSTYISFPSMEELPVSKSIFQYDFEISNIVNIVLVLRSNQNIKYEYFENVINGIIYELYFPEGIKTIDAEILKYITNIPELKVDWSDEKKMKTIEKVYQEIFDPKHPVAIAMERQKTVKEVRIIEGLDK